ncbi:MAG: cell division protein FtsL [Halioglobus sp.]
MADLLPNDKSISALAFAALGLVVLSAFGVIHSSHGCRGLYAQLQDLEATQWYLQEDYSRLLLEQSTWASHHRVEKVAGRELDMLAPPALEMKVVAP